MKISHPHKKISVKCLISDASLTLFIHCVLKNSIEVTMKSIHY